MLGGGILLCLCHVLDAEKRRIETFCQMMRIMMIVKMMTTTMLTAKTTLTKTTTTQTTTTQTTRIGVVVIHCMIFFVFIQRKKLQAKSQTFYIFLLCCLLDFLQFRQVCQVCNFIGLFISWSPAAPSVPATFQESTFWIIILAPAYLQRFACFLIKNVEVISFKFLLFHLCTS